MKSLWQLPWPERPPAIDAGDWPQFADHVARYAFAMDYADGRVIPGTGPGYGAAMLRAGGEARVVAIAFDADTITAGRERYGKAIEAVDTFKFIEQREELPLGSAPNTRRITNFVVHSVKLQPLIVTVSLYNPPQL